MAQAPFTTRKKEYPDTDYGDFLGVSREELLRELFTPLDTTMFDPATYSTLGDVSPEPLLDIESLPKRQAGFIDAFKSGIVWPTEYLTTHGYLDDPSKTTREVLQKAADDGLQRTSLEDVLESPSRFGTYMKQLAGESFGFMFTPLAAAGALAFTPAAGLASTAFLLTGTAQYFTNNIKRQADENLKKELEGTLTGEDVDPTKAFGAAVGQATLDRFMFLLPGIASIGRVVGIGGKRQSDEIIDGVVDKLEASKTKNFFERLGEAETIKGRLGKGALVVGGAELGTEVAQTIAERWQAGLPLKNNEAIKEYIEAGVGGLLLGAPIGAVTNLANSPDFTDNTTETETKTEAKDKAEPFKLEMGATPEAMGREPFGLEFGATPEAMGQRPDFGTPPVQAEFDFGTPQAEFDPPPVQAELFPKPYYEDIRNVRPLVRKIIAAQREGKIYKPTKEEEQLLLNFPEERNRIISIISKENISNDPLLAFSMEDEPFAVESRTFPIDTGLAGTTWGEENRTAEEIARRDKRVKDLTAVEEREYKSLAENERNTKYLNDAVNTVEATLTPEEKAEIKRTKREAEANEKFLRDYTSDQIRTYSNADYTQTGKGRGKVKYYIDGKEITQQIAEDAGFKTPSAYVTKAKKVKKAAEALGISLKEAYAVEDFVTKYEAATTPEAKVRVIQESMLPETNKEAANDIAEEQARENISEENLGEFTRQKAYLTQPPYGAKTWNEAFEIYKSKTRNKKRTHKNVEDFKERHIANKTKKLAAKADELGLVATKKQLEEQGKGAPPKTDESKYLRNLIGNKDNAVNDVVRATGVPIDSEAGRNAKKALTERSAKELRNIFNNFKNIPETEQTKRVIARYKNLVIAQENFESFLEVRNKAALEVYEKVQRTKAEKIHLELIHKQNELATPLPDNAVTALQNNDLKTALKEVAKEGGVIGRVANRLASLNLTTGVVITDVDIRTPVENKFAFGVFNPTTNTITLRSGEGLDNYTLLHETAHAATHHVLKTNKNGVKRVKEIFEIAKPYLESAEHGGAGWKQATMNIDEFVAEVLSNESLQNRLKEIRYKNKPMSLWDRFIDFLKGIFGRSADPRPETNLFDEAFNTINAIVSTPQGPQSGPNLYSTAVYGEGELYSATWGKLDREIKNTPKFFRKGVFLKAYGAAPEFAKNIVSSLQSLESLKKLARQYMPTDVEAAYTGVIDSIQRKAGYRHDKQKARNAVAKKIMKLQGVESKEKFETFGRLLNETTMYLLPVQTVYKEASDKGINYTQTDAYKQMQNRTSNPEWDGLNWEGTKEKFDAAYTTYKDIGPKYRDTYKSILAANVNLFNELKAEIDSTINNLVPEGQRGAIKSSLNKYIENIVAIDPYFALSRFGDFKLSYRDINAKDNSRIVEQFESEKARQAAIKKIKTEYLESKIPNAKIVNNLLNLDRFMLSKGIGRTYEGAFDPNAKGTADSADVQRVSQLYNSLTDREKEAFNGLTTELSINNAEIAEFLADKNNLPAGSVLKKLETILEQSKPDPTNVEAAQAFEQNKLDFYRVLVDNMPEVMLAGSLRKRRIPGVEGASTDIIRGFINSTDGLISKISNLKYNREMRNGTLAVQEILDTDTDMGESHVAVKYPYGTAPVNQFLKQLNKRVKFAENPSFHTLANALTSTSFHWMLGFNVSSALIQTTQVPLVIAPMLGGEYGYTPTAKAIYLASGYIRKAGVTRKFEDLAGDTARETSHPSLLNYSKLQLAKVDKELGFAEGTMDKFTNFLRERHHIGTSSMFEFLQIGNVGGELSPMRRKWAKTQQASGFLFNVSEQFNREVTALSTLILEMNRRKNKKDIDEKTLNDILFKTASNIQFYNGATSLESVPSLAHSNLGKVLMIFKSYGLTMYSLLISSLYRALPRGLTGLEGRDAEIARKQVLGIYGTAALFGGLQGLPMFWLPEAVHELFREEGEDDLQTLAQQTFASPLDRMTGISIGSRVSWKDLVLRDSNEAIRDDLSFIQKALIDAGGAPASIGTQFERGATLINEGQTYRGIEYLLPIPLRSALKSFRYYTEGAKTLRGDAIVGDVPAHNLVGQFLGFAPYSVIAQSEINAAKHRVKKELEGKKQRLLRRLHLAQKNWDTEDMGDIYEDLIELGIKNPILNITPKSIAKSMKLRTARDTIEGGLVRGIIVPKKWQDLFTERGYEEWEDSVYPY